MRNLRRRDLRGRVPHREAELEGPPHDVGAAPSLGAGDAVEVLDLLAVDHGVQEDLLWAAARAGLAILRHRTAPHTPRRGAGQAGHPGGARRAVKPLKSPPRGFDEGLLTTNKPRVYDARLDGAPG